MLSPLLNDAITRLTNSYATIESLNNFSQSATRLVVVKLPDEPNWLPPVRFEFSELSAAGTGWIDVSPTAAVPLFSTVVNYVPQFLAVANTAKNAGGNLSAEEWIKLLQTLVGPLQNNLADLGSAKDKVERALANIAAIMPALDKSIGAGWAELGDEEQLAVQLAEALGGLVDKVTSLGAKLDADAVSSGQSMLKTTVSMMYSAVSAGVEASIPVLGIAAAVFSIGKSFYDIIKDNQDLIDAMNKINALQAQLTANAVQIALTKSTLQTLYKLEAMYLAVDDAIPALIDMWQAELTKVQDAINALNAHAQPDRYLDLETIQIAATNWQGLADYEAKLENAISTLGGVVTINIGQSSITPG